MRIEILHTDSIASDELEHLVWIISSEKGYPFMELLNQDHIDEIDYFVNMHGYTLSEDERGQLEKERKNTGTIFFCYIRDNILRCLIYKSVLP